jgi:hypothetical protein
VPEQQGGDGDDLWTAAERGGEKTQHRVYTSSKTGLARGTMMPNSPKPSRHWTAATKAFPTSAASTGAHQSSVIFTFILFLIFIFKTSTSSDQCSVSRQQPRKMETSHLIQLRFLLNKGSPCFATPAVKERRRKRQFHPSALSAGSRKGQNLDAPHQISKCHVHEVSR